uniref:Uncharacterized protein n=1 Tax=viral metagenome TaxID=1070528 RepID=A0A6C0KTV2_9ZZZZ
MKSFKLIVFLFGIGIGISIGISHCNNSSDLNISSAPVCDFDVDKMHYYAIVSYEESLNPFTNSNSNSIIDLVFVFFIACSSFACSVVLVSNYVYSSMINQFVTCYNSNKLLYEYDPYLFEYLDEFNNMKSCVLSIDFLNSLKYKFLKHNSPKGEIIMNYNHLYSSFDYYCKKSNIIEFSYLDVVSRIYVVKNNCKNIYIDKCENCDYGLVNEVDADADEEAEEEKKEAEEEEEKEKEKAEEKESSIFYNKSNNKVNCRETTDYVSNRYKYKGTIEEFYTYCETNYYKIHYNDLLETSDSNLSITFSIDKEEELAKTMENIASNKNNMGFKEFKKFQKF